jgi:hypothetical protein
MAQNLGSDAANESGKQQDPIDDQTAAIVAHTQQQFTSLTQIRQARVNQLQREAAALTKAYGASDPGVQSVQASLQTEQNMVMLLGLARDAGAVATSDPPANGWVLYGRVRNADLTPAPKLTVFLTDKRQGWLEQFGYAFSDETGAFSLVYAPSAAERTQTSTSPATVTAYIEVTNSDCQIVYLDSSTVSLSAGGSVYREIVLAGGPLGAPPCEDGKPTPPGNREP